MKNDLCLVEFLLNVVILLSAIVTVDIKALYYQWLKVLAVRPLRILKTMVTSRSCNMFLIGSHPGSLMVVEI